MKMKFKILGVAALNIVFIGIIAYLISDFETPLNELGTTSAIIKGMGMSSTYDRNREIPQLDIYLIDKPFIIRLSTDNKEYWEFIYNDSNFNKTIQVNYLLHTFSQGVLNNPMQLSIDHKIIIPYSASREGIKHAIKVGIMMLFIADLAFFLLLKYEKKILAAEHKIIDLLKKLIVKI